MTLTELISEVVLITNRPDLTAETLSSVRSATLKVHQSDYFYKDIQETGISFTTPEYLQYIEYQTIIPNWRALKYLRKYDAAGKALGKFFEVVIPELTLDSYAVNREDICYVAGNVIQIRSSTKISNCLMGCYLNPLVGTSNTLYSSWIAVDHPWAIIFEAAGRVFRMIGKLEEAAAQRALAAEELNSIRLSNIQALGY
jgi:hypothetical protein